jgi:lysophospholipase L1-like esterase
MLLFVIVGLSLAQSAAALDEGSGHWVGAWSAAPLRAPIAPNIQLRRPPENPALHAQTVREFVRVDADGELLRIHLDNRYGRQPVRFGRASMALAAANGTDAIDPSSSQAITLHGRTQFVLPAGSVVDSDPVHLRTRAGERLAISLYLPDGAESASWHPDTRYRQSLSAPGDHTADADFSGAQQAAGYDWLTRIDVFADAQTQTIVALGDSITNGFRATRAHSYPEQLAERLRAARCARPVLNAGIDGNQVAAGLGNFGQGDPMRERLSHDVLDVPGARYVLLLGGINDIGEPTMAAHNAGKPTPDANAMAAPVIAALQAMAEQVKAKGMRVYGATVLPFEGTQGAYTAQGEAARQQVNDWIRHHAPYDAVIDFDAVLRDPLHPARMQARYDSGDHIHPNDAGYRAMANAVPLALFGCSQATSHADGVGR